MDLLELMIQESLLGQLFILRARTSVVSIRINADASPGCEQTNDLDIFGIHEADEILHDDVDTVLMEIAMVAKAE